MAMEENGLQVFLFNAFRTFISIGGRVGYSSAADQSIEGFELLEASE
jgi:hypothetical protein